MNKKITIAVSSIVIIAILAVISFFIVKGVGNNRQMVNQNVNVNKNQNVNQVSNEEIDTSDWLTYRNEEYGYSIKYPKDWSIREFPGTKTGAEFTGTDCQIIVDAGGAGGEEHLNDIFDEYIYIAGLGVEGIDSINSIKDIITNSGIKGYITTWKGDKGVSGERVFFESKKHGYFNLKAVEIRYGIKVGQNCVKFRDTMIKTFDYID